MLHNTDQNEVHVQTSSKIRRAEADSIVNHSSYYPVCGIVKTMQKQDQRCEDNRPIVQERSLSQLEGVVAAPLSHSSSCNFCILAENAIRSKYLPFVQVPMYMYVVVEKIGGWVIYNDSLRLEWEVMAAKIIIFS